MYFEVLRKRLYHLQVHKLISNEACLQISVIFNFGQNLSIYCLVEWASEVFVVIEECRACYFACQLTEDNLLAT